MTEDSEIQGLKDLKTQPCTLHPDPVRCWHLTPDTRNLIMSDTRHLKPETLTKNICYFEFLKHGNYGLIHLTD